MTLCETQRMLLRRLTRDDLPELSAILSDPEVMEPSVRGVCDEAATSEFIGGCLGCYRSHGFGPLALVDKSSAELVGFCGISPEEVDGTEEFNLGYRLATRFWRRGLAAEAARAVLDDAFSRSGLDSVVVIIEPEHAASLRVAEKAGFREFDNVKFHSRLVRLYRLTREQWHAPDTRWPSGPT